VQLSFRIARAIRGMIQAADGGVFTEGKEDASINRGNSGGTT
jgi:hypothetical protein